MSTIDLVLAVVGGLVLLLGLVSRRLRSWGLPDPLIALLIGVLLGPAGVGLLDVHAWGRQEIILGVVAQVALAVGLMGAALGLPKGYPRHAWAPVAVLLAVVMPVMWLAGSALVYLTLGVSLLTALLIGAVLAPTDPVAAFSIVYGDLAERYLPRRLRHLLLAESGANDGLGYLFVLLSLLLLTMPANDALGAWLTGTLLRQVGGAIVMGGAIGYAAGRMLGWAERHHAIEEPSFLAFTLALALFTLGVVQLAGSEGVVAVFAAWLAFDSVVSARDRTTEERVIEGMDRFLTLPVFTLLGVAIPWDAWAELDGAVFALILGVLLLRRLPVVLLTRPLMRPLEDRSDALFIGWFGPLGVSAVYYASLSVQRTGLTEVWEVTSLLICASVVVHGLTAAPWVRRYARAEGVPEEDGTASAPDSGGPQREALR
jgi:sodium/hydrogen antiporter